MDFDPIETCPYDNVHRIRRSRMQFHITTCSKNFPASKMMHCPFDARHKVNQVEFEYHKNHCPARESVISYAIHDPTIQAEQKILPIEVKPVGTADEDWDEGANVKSYNPLQAIKDKPIVYPIIGLSKAKRKNHRLQERQRFNLIMENSGNQNTNQNGEQSNSLNAQSSSTAQDDNDNDEDEETYKPLRKPRFLGMDKKSETGNKVSPDKNRASLPSIPEMSNSKKSSRKVEKTPNVPNGPPAALPKNKENSTVKKPKDDFDNSVIDELSKTVEELFVSHKEKTKSLDEQIKKLKKEPLGKKANAV